LLLERGFDTATVVAVLVLLGPSQVAGRIAVWGIAERASVRAIGRVVVLAFPIALVLLLLLPPTFASLAVFATLSGAANGILTIVRGIAVPEMLTREAYGAINSVLAIRQRSRRRWRRWELRCSGPSQARTTWSWSLC